MAGSARIKGKKIAIIVNGVDYWQDITSCTFDNEEAGSDVTTFADANAGGARQHFATVGAIQSTQTSSFWRFVWANTGAEFAYKYAPHGNAVATADEPHLVGTLRIGAKPPLGSEAGLDNTSVFETRFDTLEEPVLDEGTGNIALISSILPLDAEVGDQVILYGTRLSEATAVKFAAATAEFIHISDNALAVVVPAGTGVKAVTVVNAGGTSDAFSYTVAA